MTVAHVLSVTEAPRGPLDFELAAIRLDYEERTRADLARCRRLHALWGRWQLERNTSLRDFLRTAFPDFEEREGTSYAHVYAGAALNAGLPGSRIAHLEPFGWALMTGGKTPADLRALIEEKGEEATRSLLRQERSRKASEGTTLRRMPESAAKALDGLSERLRVHPDAPVEDTERRGMAVRMLEAVAEIPPLWDAVATMASTGEATLDALTQALRVQQPDFYEELKRLGCTHPGCGVVSKTHLHHVPHGEQTRRGGDFLVCLCEAHHMPTATGQSAHSMDRWAWFDLWGGEAAFLWAVWERYAQAAQAMRRRQA